MQLTWVSDTHAWTLPLVFDTHTQLYPFSRACFPVIKSPRKLIVQDPSTVHSGRRCDCKAGVRPCCQVAENAAIRHVTAVSLAYLQVLVYLRLLAYLFGRSVWEEGGRHPYSDTHACQFRQACMESLLRKRNMHACLKEWWNLFYIDGRHLETKKQAY